MKNKKLKTKPKKVNVTSVEKAVDLELAQYMVGTSIRANDDDFMKMGIQFTSTTKMVIRRIVKENGVNIISPAFTTASHIEKGSTEEYQMILVHKICGVVAALYFKYITDDPLCQDTLIEIIETSTPTFSLMQVDEE